MTDPTLTSQEEPKITSALPSAADMARNFKEAETEVQRRVRFLLTRFLQEGRHPSRNDLRRLGPDGEAYYTKMMGKVALPGIRETAHTRAGPQQEDRHQPKSHHAHPVLLASVEWRRLRHRRRSFTQRARLAGWRLAGVLLFVAVVLLNLVTHQGTMARLALVGSLWP